MASTAFDAQADRYDQVAESALGRALRARVHELLAGHIAPGDTVVDLGCGSGIDAAWLAPQVGSVQAFDASAEMVALTRRRCASYANVTVEQRDVASVTLDEPVDFALANFGVVNCVGNLETFGTRLHGMIKPGGQAIIVTMAKWCPLELAIGVATANKQLATRRRQPGAAVLSGSETGYSGLEIRYASGRDLARAFGSRFELAHAESLGTALPPFEQRHWVENRPRLLASLVKLDRRFSSVAARIGVGDHHLAVLRRRP